MRAAIAVSVAFIAAGCTRDAAAPICPDVAVGELVVSEIHDDHGTAWIEVYNASGRELDLEGTRVRFRKIDGTSEIAALVRRELVVPAAGYVVLGYATEDSRPSYVDYGFAGDWHDASWLDSAAVDVEACGARVDRVLYSGLPTPGSYALGTTPPTADDNDLPARWCSDPVGSPQQANPPCP